MLLFVAEQECALGTQAAITQAGLEHDIFRREILTRLAGIPIAREHTDREIVSIQKLLQLLADVAARMHGCVPYLTLCDSA